jgi:hypothetical protein
MKSKKLIKMLSAMLVATFVLASVPYGVKSVIAEEDNEARDAGKVKYEIHRIYNPNSGEHFLTYNTKEIEKIVNLGWKDEGFRFDGFGEGNAIYRIYNPNSGEHFYTINVEEKNKLINLGWKDEGIAWYSELGLSTTHGLATYRLYNSYARGQYEAGGHLFTTSEQERDKLIELGWKDEGIAWYEYNKTGALKPDASDLEQ